MTSIKLALISTLALLFVPSSALCGAATPPKAYAVVEIKVTDAQAYKQYIHAVTPVVTQFRGKYIVRGGTVIPLEGKAPAGRVVIIEFPSLALAKSFEDSPQYLKIAPLRHRASRSRLFLVEGSPEAQ